MGCLFHKGGVRSQKTDTLTAISNTADQNPESAPVAFVQPVFAAGREWSSLLCHFQRN